MKYIFNFKKLASDILAKREKDNLSLRAVSDQTGISSQLVYTMEAGANIPNCENFAIILGWLSKKPSDYFTLKTKKNA
jgi:transcriptional regulator with XRE-family HTH domain